MPGYVICPYCSATVQARVGANGEKVCPVCDNKGRRLSPVGAPAQAATPTRVASTGPSGPQLPNAPGATASLVLGIVGALTGVLGLILGIIAILQAGSAKRAIQENPGRYQGEGLATAGRILGIVAIVLGAFGLLFAIFVFATVDQLARESNPAILPWL